MDKNPTEREPQIKPFIYNDDEVFLMRRVLSGEVDIPETLADKIQGDPLFSDCSVAMFFPVIGERISKNGERPIVIPLHTGTREKALTVIFPDCAYVIKSIENSNEPAIVALMAEIGVCPEQYESLNGYITETFVEGTEINRLDTERCTPEFMEEIGRKIGVAIKKIHDKNILINDQLFSDDYGKSHTIIGPNNEVTFIDFGAAVNLSNYPELSDEQLDLIIRSCSLSTKLKLGVVQNGSSYAIDFRQQIIDPHTMDESLRFFEGTLINEGFYFLGNQIPNIDDMVKGYLQSKD